MEYFLVYQSKHGLRSAIPDIEGVYRKDIKFADFREEVAPNEVFILETEQKVLDDENCYAFVITSKFVAEEPIVKLINKLGFEKLFTSIIKEHITKEFSK